MEIIQGFRNISKVARSTTFNFYNGTGVPLSWGMLSDFCMVDFIGIISMLTEGSLRTLLVKSGLLCGTLHLLDWSKG